MDLLNGMAFNLQDKSVLLMVRSNQREGFVIDRPDGWPFAGTVERHAVGNQDLVAEAIVNFFLPSLLAMCLLQKGMP